MNLQEFIKKLIAEGKTDKEIANAILQHDEFKDLSTGEVLGALSTYKKMVEVQAALDSQKSEEDKYEQKKKFDESVEDGINQKLKSITLDPAGKKYGKDKELKRFNVYSGKFEGVNSHVTEAYGTFNNMIKAMGNKDWNSAKSISKEIHQDNQTKEAFITGVKATPSVSDSNSRGGYYIPTEVDDMLMQLIYSQSALFERVNKQIVNYLSKVFPVMGDITVSYIADQSTGVAEKNPAFYNPTVTMHRVGGYSTFSNLFLEQRADLVNAFLTKYGSSFASFMDLHIAAGNVTGASDMVDGIIFDPNTLLPSAYALTDLTASKLKDLKNSLSASVNLKDCAWIANRKVSDVIGLLENTAGNYTFPGYVEGRGVAPFGIPLITNPQIPSVLAVGEDNRTGGTDDALILADLSKTIVGISGETRIDVSEHAFFTDDIFALRAIKMYGQKVVMGSGNAGVVAIAQELTN